MSDSLFLCLKEILELFLIVFSFRERQKRKTGTVTVNESAAPNTKLQNTSGNLMRYYVSGSTGTIFKLQYYTGSVIINQYVIIVIHECGI